MPQSSVAGECAAAFQPLADLLQRNLDDGTDVGAGLAVVHDGELVVDLYGGEARPGVAWTHDTLVQVWSVTKVMAALAVLRLVDDGTLDLDAPVATWWPAFGAAGKRGVTVRQLLGHTSGLPGWSEPVSVELALDLEASEALLAAQEPWYAPGSAPAYQILDHGHLLDGLVRGATGRALAEVLHDDVLAPLGGGFRLGVPEAELDRCADLLPPDGSSLDVAALGPDHFLLRAFLNPVLSTRVCNSPEWRRGAFGAAGGHGTAWGIARAQALLSHGGVAGGTRMLGEQTVERVFEPVVGGRDLVLEAELVYGAGWALPSPAAPAVPPGRVCWWTGYGGSIVVNDADRRVTVAYVANRMVDHMVRSERTDAYLTTAFACLEDLS